MSRRTQHRGPDASGTWDLELSATWFAAGLVHCRLSILDLDKRANQPMSDASGRFTIVFNGEIYNFRQLRAEIARELPGFRFRTDCDTEVILAAYALWGEKCLERLEGMFAFVLVDSATRTVFAARDRMGQKPLYLAAVAADGRPLDLVRSGGMDAPIAAVAFASEIGALLSVPWVDKAARPESLVPYLMWGYIPAPGTIYRGIESLPPAHGMTIALQQARTWRYFDPNLPRQSFIPGETDVDATRRLVLQAVKRQLVSDVPVGCFLSGGMDSSIIAAAMRHARRDQQVLTFSVGFTDARYDETAYAKAVADHLKTEHHQFNVTLDAAADLPRIVSAFGQPFADSSAIPTYHLARVTREHVKVALSGDGGDEMFGGYDRYRAVKLAASLHPGLRYAMAMPIWQRMPGVHPKSRLQRFKRFIEPLNLPAGRRYARYMELFGPRDLARLLGRPVEPEYERYISGLYAELLESRDDVAAALATDRLTYLPEDLHNKVDRCSMQHALEVRSPFMDTDLVQFAAGLDAGQLLTLGSKSLLRAAFAGDLPPGHFERPKMGFAVPIGEWLRTDLREMLHDHVTAAGSFARAQFDVSYLQRLMDEHAAGKRDHAQRLYALLVLELWHRERAEA